MLDRVDDTIVAISSAPGYGALGIVRLSGPEAIRIADRMTSAAAGGPLASRPGSTRMSGEVLIDADTRLPAVFYVFRSPHSYTRQDMVEIYTVGSPAALDLVRRRALDLGALAAEPGEFTARAFLSGAMDLASAEAVAGIIRAQTDTQLRASRRMMDGELSKQVRESRDNLAELVALVEADIDFAEEPIEFITPPALRDRLADINVRLQPLLQVETCTERLEVLPRILLFGPPNAGKSSLMNRLSGTSRAICAAAGGTTRDILSAPICLDRGEAILLDTAGLHDRTRSCDDLRFEAPRGLKPAARSCCTIAHGDIDRSQDDIIAQARAMTLLEAKRVDLICVVVDVTAADDEHLCSTVRSLDAPVVVAANKSDLLSTSQLTDVVDGLKHWRTGPVCAVSAKDGTGIDTLRARFAEALGTTATTTLGEAVVLSERQRRAVRNASEAIRRAVALSENATETIDCADLLAFELREALDALGSVTGEVTTEDLLAQVFANFCIGK